MADPFKDLYADEKNLRLAERAEAKQRTRKWQIATAAVSVALALVGTAYVMKKPQQPALK